MSHAAPAHHFAGLAGLETAIVARAFSMFARVMRAQAEAAGTDAIDRLLAMGRRYCDFARDHGPLFQLMFVSDTVDHRDPELATAQGDAYSILCEACAPFITPKTDPALIRASVWSITHGYALLQFDRPDCGNAAPEPAPPLETILRHLLRLDA